MTTPAGTTMEEMEELEKRLREFHPCGKHSNMPCYRCAAADAIRALVAERDALQKDAEVEQWRQRHREDCEMRTNNPACTCDFFTKGGELSPAIRAALAAQQERKP